MPGNKLITALMIVLLLTAGSVQAGGSAANGRALAVNCVACHGEDGLGDEEIPAIAGMDAAKLARELADFKSGARVDEDEIMAENAVDLSEQDMADLATYYATLPGRLNEAL